MITILTDGFPVEIEAGAVITALIINLLVAVGFYLLRSIGLYTLAKNQGVKGAFMAWIPCVWIYVACKIVKDTKVFNITLDKLAIWFTIIFSVTELLTLAFDFMFYFPLVGNYFVGNEIYIYMVTEEATIPAGLTPYLFGGDFIALVGDNFVYPYKDIFLAQKIADALNYSLLLFGLLSTIIEVVVLFNIFRTYWPERFILGFVLSVFFDLTGLMLFLIRKKQPVDFAEYSRNRYGNYRDPYYNDRRYYDNYQNRQNHQNYQRQNRQYQDEPFGGYNQNNTQNQNNNPSDEPFSDYTDKGN